jgi:hypothetical protein
MSAHELGVYLEMKGLLHDCSVSWRDFVEGRFSLEVADVNAATHGLSEYEGARSLTLELDGAAMTEMDVPASESKVFEASASSTGGEASIGEFRVTFWPAGHMTLTFSAARVTESVVETDASGASIGEQR